MDPYPRRWRYGWVDVGYGAPTWRPRFGLLRPLVHLPASATISEIREVSGLVEGFFTNPGCRIVDVKAGDVSLEMGIMSADLLTALLALTSGTGGAWRVAESLDDWDDSDEDPEDG